MYPSSEDRTSTVNC
jgi:hypothetical protein